MLHRKIAAVAVVFLLVGVSLGSDLDNEQMTRLNAIKARAAAGKATIGDMHEAGAHYRILAARLRDSGLETKLDAYMRDSNNTNSLIANCAAHLPKGMTKADCQTVLTMLRTNGSHTMMQAIASVAYNASLWGSFIPTGYQGGAHYVPVLLPNCRGVGQAIAAASFISAALWIIPGGEPAAGIGTAFSLLLALIAAGVC